MFYYMVGLFTGFVLFSCPAKAADESYCALYAREATRIDIMHTTDIDKMTADTDYILTLAIKVFNECNSILPTPLPLPAEHRDMDTWLADMRDLLLAKSAVASIGTEPATEEKKSDGGLQEADGEEAWRAQCRAEYNTWDNDTGTVIRRGNPERVRCPCGTEVQCVP